MKASGNVKKKSKEEFELKSNRSGMRKNNAALCHDHTSASLDVNNDHHRDKKYYLRACSYSHSDDSDHDTNNDDDNKEEEININNNNNYKQDDHDYFKLMVTRNIKPPHLDLDKLYNNCYANVMQKVFIKIMTEQKQ